MRRILLVAVIAVGTVGAAAPAASADFPEQPGDHLAKGCIAVVSKSKATFAPRSDKALSIVVPLLNDACAPS